MLIFEKKMKLLITGATGLVGRQLVKKAISQGMMIHYLTTQASKIQSIEGAKGFHWNPSRMIIDIDCFLGVDVIIHLAGASISKRWTDRYKKIILSSRIDTTRLLINGLNLLKGNHCVEQIVSASAIGIYPSDFKNFVFETFDVSKDSFMQNVVMNWEEEVDVFQTMNIKITKLRIGLVLARNGGVVATLKIPTFFCLGAAFGSGNQGQSWIHMSDVVGIILFCIKKQLIGNFNTVAPNPVSQSIFISALAKALKRPHIFPPIPKYFTKMILGDMSSLVLDSHWVSSKKILGKGYKFQFDKINDALKEVLK